MMTEINRRLLSGVHSSPTTLDTGERPDISLVFNLHNETSYLRRTVTALEEATRYAQSFGLRVELVVVLDRPAASTKAWISNCDFSTFDAVFVTECDHGSLGLARNAGMPYARGQYIATVDADDLMSYNLFHECYIAARSHGPNAIVIQQYVIAFGHECFAVEYLGSDSVSTLGFFSYHPGVSRIFAHRSLFERMKYSDARLTSGYAYEDWHFTCNAITHGYQLVIAPSTIMFYRQRPGSLLRVADRLSVRQIPPSLLFEPQTFLAICARDFERFCDGLFDLKDATTVRNAFAANPTCWELTHAASKIDPAITIRRPDDIPVYTNLTQALDAGAAYFRIARLVAGRRFTDVVLLPYISTGGGDKYILDVVESLTTLDPSRHFLILTGEPFGEHAWLDRLPGTAVFLDLTKVGYGCSELELQLITLRLLENVASDAILHVKSCVYAVRFIEKFHPVLKPWRIVFYRFSDPQYAIGHLTFCAGYVFNFLSEYGIHFWRIVTDNDAIALHDTERLDVLSDRYRTLRAVCHAPEIAVDSRPVQQRILWASRLDSEKRPDLLVRIAKALYARRPALTIDVYGSSVMGAFDVARFEAEKNMRYCGSFDSFFRQIDAVGYDLFLYTTAFDGLPNVVLEAMAAGLPVIAPDVGGLGEVVRSGVTGWLLLDHADEEALVADYIAAIDDAYAPTTNLGGIQRAAAELIRARHTWARYLETVGEIFEVVPSERDAASKAPIDV